MTAKKKQPSKRQPFARLIGDQNPKKPKRKWTREERIGRPCPKDKDLPFAGW